MTKIVGNKDIKYIRADIPPTYASSLSEKMYLNKAKKAIIQIAIVIIFSIYIF